MSVIQEKVRRQMMVTGLKGPKKLAPLTSTADVCAKCKGIDFVDWRCPYCGRR